MRWSAVLFVVLVSAPACFDQAPTVGTVGTGGTGGTLGEGGSSSMTTATADSGVTSGDTAGTCDEGLGCRAAPPGWNGPHVLLDAGAACPPGTSEGQNIGRQPAVCTCSCDDATCVAQAVAEYPSGCNFEPAPLPTVVARNGCTTIDSGAILVQPPAESAPCDGGDEQRLTWCDAPACIGGTCLPDDAAASTRFGACVWCEGNDAECPACPIEFPQRVPLRQGPPAPCECCASQGGEAVCNGIHDGCPPTGPALPVGRCVEVTDALSFAPGPVICMEPAASPGTSFIACCERDQPMP